MQSMEALQTFSRYIFDVPSGQCVWGWLVREGRFMASLRSFFEGTIERLQAEVRPLNTPLLPTHPSNIQSRLCSSLRMRTRLSSKNK